MASFLMLSTVARNQAATGVTSQQTRATCHLQALTHGEGRGRGEGEGVLELGTKPFFRGEGRGGEGRGGEGR